MIVLCHLRRKKVFPVGQVQEDLAALLPNLANQMRGLLSNLYLAASQAIPAEAREQDPVLDAKAAVLDQSFYRLLRLGNSLSSAEYLAAAQPAALRDADLVKLIGEVCESAGDLLSNALKFTPAGGTVTVELKKSGGELLLSVTDTGCGISPEQMEHLFDGYLHTQAVPRRGLGLGLPLCRAIAERHGGGIAVESVPGQGSCFTVFLPDRQSGTQVSDVTPLYASGFNRPLMGLADALPAAAYTIRNQD